MRKIFEPQNKAELYHQFNRKTTEPPACPFAVAPRPNQPQPRVVDVGPRNPETRAAENCRGGPELRAARAKELAAIGFPSTVWGRTWRHWIGQAATLPAMIEWALKLQRGDGSGTPKKIQLNGVVCDPRP